MRAWASACLCRAPVWGALLWRSLTWLSVWVRTKGRELWEGGGRPPLPLLLPIPPIGSRSYSLPSHLFPVTHWRECFSSALPFLRVPLLLRPILHALGASRRAWSPSLPCLLPCLPSVFGGNPESCKGTRCCVSRCKAWHGRRTLLHKSL